MRPVCVTSDRVPRASPKSRNLQLTLGRDENIRRLDVPMDDVAPVCVCQAFAHVDHDLQFAVVRQPAAANRPTQIGAVQVLHHDVRTAVGFADVVDRDQVVVRQTAGCLCLAEKPRACFLIGHEICGDRLDGDAAADDRIDRLVHAAHAALPEHADDLILTDGFH